MNIPEELGPVEAPVRPTTSRIRTDDPAFDIFAAIVPEETKRPIKRQERPKKETVPSKKQALSIERFYTQPGVHPFDTTEWVRRTSRITDEKGNVIFEMTDAEVPAGWSQLATDIIVSKYFRKAGVPQVDSDGSLLKNPDGTPVLGPERSAKQTISRLAGAWRWWGQHYGYFASQGDAEIFEHELLYMLTHQIGSPNSPQWFNTGLSWAYGITGPAQGHSYVDQATGQFHISQDAYSRPAPHACFIQTVTDDLVNPGGIMDLVTREARIFKYGSGTGSNFSPLRGKGEPLSGGGQSSGLMSWLKIFDTAAGAVKSGGTTRRAAKMVILDMDHPDIETFITWKAREEDKALALIRSGYPADFNGEAYQTVSGQNSNNSVRVADDFMKAVAADGDWALRWRTDPNRIAKTLKARHLWQLVAQSAWRCADPGVQYDTVINDWHTCPNSGRINASNPCVTGDTLVATEHGYRPIAELVDTQINIVSGDGTLRPSLKVWKTGHKPIYDLQTKAGYRLRLTADHRVRTVNRGDIPADQLTENDELELQGAPFGTDYLNPQAAELIGLAVGDGCITRSRNQEMAFITFGKQEAQVAEETRATINQIKVQAVTAGQVDWRSARPTFVSQVATGLRVGTSSQPVIQLLKQYAVLDQKAIQKRFTNAVFNLDQKSLAGLLRGLFTADGTVANYGEKSQYISLDSTSLKLVEQVQLLLLSFGIKTKLYRNRRKVGQTINQLPDGRGGSAEYPVAQIHSLRISRASRLRFEQLIGFCPACPKTEQLASLNRLVNTYQEPLTDRVVQVTPAGTADVYDLSEPVTEHFVANGIVVHNCSEYMFLDDTACNLCSLNLMKFYDEKKKRFDIPAFRHACRLWTTVLEISVAMAQFPSEAIARRSWEFRTLGLGYANLGTLLMVMGIPYDSDQGRAISAALTAIMTGQSYATSAELAKNQGPFPGYTKNREAMLKVIRNHRRVAYMAPDEEFESLHIIPPKIDQTICPADLLKAAHNTWDEALEWGKRWGYRNAQTTLIAPTGTIGLQMDCDTTGVEPDFALVKFKKLAGGGNFKIINQSVPRALTALGYTDSQVHEIVEYAIGTGTLDNAPQINRESLREKGLADAEIDRINEHLPGIFDLRYAFNNLTVAPATFDRLGLKDRASDPSFNFLQSLGFSEDQIEEANKIICGRMTVEGAPHLKEEHLPVFDCANKCGKYGQRYLRYGAHLEMMGAVQPFLSGSISKTVNMPNEATVNDVARAYQEGWQLALKSVALYRDGSKGSQPLSTSVQQSGSASAGERVVETKIEYRPFRRRLPDERQSITHKFSIAGHEGYITVGLYEDGRPGEIFVKMSKQGSILAGLMDAFAISVSFALQYGMPLSFMVNKFSHVRFEPSGFTKNPQIPIAKSIIDYIFRWLAIKFLPREEWTKLGIHDSGSPVTNPILDDQLPPTTTSPTRVAVHEVDESQQLTMTFNPKNQAKVAFDVFGDAPMCTNCGGIMVRSGTCYKCLGCGETSGCS